MILVCGAGAIGSFIAYSLKKSDKEVELISRGKRLEEIKKHGLKVKNRITGKTDCVKIDTYEKYDLSKAYDFIFVVVPNDKVHSVIDDIPQEMDFKNIVFIGNNVQPELTEKKFKNKFGNNKKVMFGFINIMASINGETDLYFSSYKAGIHITDMGNNESIKEIFNSTSIKPVFEKDMTGFLKTHGAFVLPLSYLCYAFKGKLKNISADRNIMDELVMSMEEGFDILERNGFKINPKIYKTVVQKYKFLLKIFGKIIFNTSLGDIMITEHSQRCMKEILYMDNVFGKMIDNSGHKFEFWDKIRNMWDRKNG